jgi:formamidopyrimidine-DNA glycosylase
VPELPDVAVYVEHIQRRAAGDRLERVRLANPFILRTAQPPIAAAHGKRVEDVRRVGKRIVLALEGDLFLVIHLMIAGRLHWKSPDAKMPGKLGVAAFDFSRGTLLFTEAGTKKRAALHLVEGERQLAALDPGGLEVLEANLDAFRQALVRENHTLKRALTDPHLFSGIGNSYSDEILHRARLSPVTLTSRLSPDEVDRLHRATRETLLEWTGRLRREAGDAFPEKVTAFRDEMAVHGRFGKPCPVCGAPIQRIVYSENEANYCARCQTGGKLLADRALSRLLREDWPRSLDDQMIRSFHGSGTNTSTEMMHNATRL